MTCAPRAQTLPALAVKGAPHVGAAVLWHLQVACRASVMLLIAKCIMLRCESSLKLSPQQLSGCQQTSR